MRVLWTTVDPDSRGGVAGFSRILRPAFNETVDFLVVGARTPDEKRRDAVKRLIRDSIAFKRALATGHYDIVHLNPSLDAKAVLRDGLLLLVARRMRVPVVVFFHGWKRHFVDLLGKGFKGLFRRVFSRADLIIVLAQEFMDDLRKLGFNQRVEIGSVAISHALLAAGNEEAITGTAPREPKTFCVLFLSRIEKAKGIYEAIDAFRIQVAANPDARLLIAGDGSELPAVKEYVKKHGVPGVTFTGHIEGQKKIEALLGADVYLFPSHTEGMPISVLEAMAFGLPVITRPVGALKDFFENEKMGFMTASLDSLVIAKLLERLAADAALRRSIGLYNFRFVRERFVPANVAKSLEDMYRSVLEARQGQGSNNARS